MPNDRAIFAISDLHIGDGGPRDNFAVGDRRGQLNRFLDHVAEEDGELIILGDLFEFWQASLSTVITRNLGLLDRLAELDATYVIGNHDIDLAAFIGDSMLNHPFFRKMCGPFTRKIGGKQFKFMHGHEVDPFNKDEAPSWGRMMTIFAGICEDKNGAPMLGDKPVEELLSCVGELALRGLHCLSNKYAKHPEDKTRSAKGQMTPAQNPSRAEEMRRHYADDRKAGGYDVAVVGHTHEPGRMSDWYFNTGSWATTANNFVRITPDGKVNVFDWADGIPSPNDTILSLPSADAGGDPS